MCFVDNTSYIIFIQAMSPRTSKRHARTHPPPVCPKVYLDQRNTYIALPKHTYTCIPKDSASSTAAQQSSSLDPRRPRSAARQQRRPPLRGGGVQRVPFQSSEAFNFGIYCFQPLFRPSPSRLLLCLSFHQPGNRKTSNQQRRGGAKPRGE